MIGYASRTGTRRNLAALRAAGWRLIVSATGVHRTEGFHYALDNGAWTAHQQGRAFDVAAFKRLVAQLGADADFVVAPDIVGGGLPSLDLSLSWLPRLMSSCARVLIPVQEGMTADDLRPHLSSTVGIFVGGQPEVRGSGRIEWKLLTLPTWAALARERSAYLHVGRVNTQRRILACSAAGADSFDGTCASRYVCTLPGLDRALRQRPLGLP